MTKYKIIFEKDKCIGATSCNDACPDNWQIQPDGKSKCRYEEFDEESLRSNLSAAKACPVKCIHIINTETKQKII